MGGEDVRRGHDLKSGVEIEIVLRDVQPNTFERKKGRVSFIHVKDFRLITESAQCLYAADPENDFLAHPHLEIAAV